MAKRKRKHSRKRSRSVGALSPSSPVAMVAAIAAGYFLGDTINTAIDKVLPASLATGTGVMGYIPAAAESLAGALILKSKKKSLIKTAAGGVLLGAGLKRGLKKAGIISGYQSVPVIGKRIRGYQSVPVIGGLPSSLTGGLGMNQQLDYGANTPNSLSGYGINGYRPNGSRGTGIMGAVVPANAGAGQPASGICNTGSGYLN